MKSLLLPAMLSLVLAAVVYAQDNFSKERPSPELVSAVERIKKLNAQDFTALKSWFSGQGRKLLHDRGITDDQIGGLRLDTDQFNDAPFGK